MLFWIFAHGRSGLSAIILESKLFNQLFGTMRNFGETTKFFACCFFKSQKSYSSCSIGMWKNLCNLDLFQVSTTVLYSSSLSLKFAEIDGVCQLA
jgi:hypothetical protein